MSQSKFFNILRRRPFYLLLVGNVFYSLGNAIFTICLNWWVLISTESEIQLGIVGTLNFVAMMIFGIISGILVDNFHRKKIIFVSIMFRGLFIMIFPILGVSGILQLWMVYLITFAQYTTFPFLVNGVTAIMPQFIEEEYMMPANALIDTSFWLSNIIGFLSGGFLINIFGIYPLIFISSLMFFISPFFFLKIPYLFERRISNSSISNFFIDIKDGFHLMFKDKVLVVVVFTWTGIITLFSMGPTNIGWPVFSEKVLNANEIGYGLLVAVSSFSALIGSLALSIWGHRFKMGQIFLMGLILGGTGMIAFSFTSILSLSLLIIFITYFFYPMLNVPYWTALQNRMPEKELGKVTGASFTINTGLSPISTFFTGMIMQNVSIILPFILSGFSFYISFIIAFSNKGLRTLE
jgi:MFS family permease